MLLVVEQDFRLSNKRKRVGDIIETDNTTLIKYLISKELAQIKEIVLHKNKGKHITIYQEYIYKIGGIETFLFNFAKVFNEYNITVMYKRADYNQLVRLSKYVNVRKDTNEIIDCDIFIACNYHNIAKCKKRLKANKVYQMIHADLSTYKDIYYTKDEIVDDIITVSKSAYDGLLSKNGYTSKCIYNLLDLEAGQKIKFITLSRMTKEKGLQRIIKMIEELKNNNINFVWYICSDLTDRAKKDDIDKLLSYNEVVLVPANINNVELISACDYLVQLSDTESFCYSMYEALQRKVPVIVTEFKEAKRIIKDGENGYIIKFDMSNLDINKICNQKPKEINTEFKNETEKWIELLK